MPLIEIPADGNWVDTGQTNTSYFQNTDPIHQLRFILASAEPSDDEKVSGILLAPLEVITHTTTANATRTWFQNSTGRAINVSVTTIPPAG